MEDIEENYQEPVRKFNTFGNLENAKRAFVSRDYDKFEQELKLAPYCFFRSTYNYPSLFDGKFDFIAANFTSGLVQELDNYRKYFFVVHRCVQPTSTEKKYEFKSMWIVNTSSVEDIYGDRYNDFTFSQVDSSNTEELDCFLKEFRHQYVLEETTEENVNTEVYDEPYDPFSFCAEDENEETIDTNEEHKQIEQVVSPTEYKEEQNVLISEQYLH